MKRILCLALALVFLCGSLVSCGGDSKYKRSKEPTDYVVLVVKDYGEILIELYPDAAPITVANFKKLVSEKAYNNTIFHRVINGFVIQGGGFNRGDRVERDRPNEADTIVGEFASNGYENPLSHARGVVSMARLGTDNDSASNQFFICHTDERVQSLNGEYAAFGVVLEGMDVVDEIATVLTNYYDQPYIDVVLTRAYFTTAPEK